MSDAAGQRRVLDLFEQAIDWPDDEREARLAALEPSLAERVRRLLAREAGARRNWPTAPAEPVALGPEPPPPERIGPWRLTRRLGDGGMGAVYLGERDDGLFEQAVAIKLMRPGLFTAAAAAQFDSERRLLARLRHPNIARLFDGGFDADGRSWLAMERIDGEAITKHVAERRLGPREIVRLVREVCAAVQHAHQALIVHADIKPPNVLVDETGAPKLLDFGIARSLAVEADAATSGVGLTAAYASPQRRAGERPVPADDIYALGVLLRELLSGEQPDEAGRTPPLPDPDLAAIADRATAADPAHRYVGAEALSDDLGRWLERRPVAARPAPWSRMARLFAVRHPLAVTAAAAAVMGLIGAATISSALYLRAEQQRAQAERRFAEVRSLARFMLLDLSDRLQGVPGGAVLRRDAANEGRRYLEQLAAVPGASPDLRLETAVGYGRVGHAMALSTIQSVGDTAAGEDALARAEAMLRRLHAGAPGRDDVTRELARVLAWRGGVIASAHARNAEGAALSREAVALLDGVLARSPGDVAAAYLRWNAVVGLSDLLNAAGDSAAVAGLHRDALARARSVPTPPEFAVTRPLLEATSEQDLGDAIYDSAAPQPALAHYQRAVAVLERARASSAVVDARVADRLALALWSVSGTYSEANRPAEALAWIDRAAAITDALTAVDRTARSQRVAGIVHLQRAVTLSALGRHAEAVADARAVIDLRTTLAASQPRDADLRRSVAAAWRPLAETYERAGRHVEACDAARRSRDIWAELQRAGIMNAYDRRTDLAVTTAFLARC